MPCRLVGLMSDENTRQELIMSNVQTTKNTRVYECFLSGEFKLILGVFYVCVSAYALL